MGRSSNRSGANRQGVDSFLTQLDQRFFQLRLEQEPTLRFKFGRRLAAASGDQSELGKHEADFLAQFENDGNDEDKQ